MGEVQVFDSEYNDGWLEKAMTQKCFAFSKHKTHKIKTNGK